MKNLRKIARGQRGFTLIELVMVIVILGILAAVAIPQFGDLTTQAETAACDSAAGALASSATTLLATNRGATSTRQEVIANTALDPDITTANGATGVITVTVGNSSCSTINLNAAGLTSD